MTLEKVETLVVGGGQAGVAMSEHLSKCGVPHLILERGRIAERWRSQRWDSLVANGPAWHDRFPGMEFPRTGPDDFASKEEVADYFVAYAKQINAPIRCGVEVKLGQRNVGRPEFRVKTSDGVVEANSIVAATGPFQIPVIPPVVPGDAGMLQIHSSAYRNPEQLPKGAVLVVGTGSSGVQIADDSSALASASTFRWALTIARRGPIAARRLLVAGRPRQVGRRDPGIRHRTRHGRGERRARRRDDRFPSSGRAGAYAPRYDKHVPGRRDELRARSGEKHCPWRRKLDVAAG